MRLGIEYTHRRWDNTIPPAWDVKPGDTIELELLDSSDGQITPISTATDVAALDLTRINPVTGPIYVADAEPGDALVVHIRSIHPESWGWTGILPNVGLLADTMTEPSLWHAEISHDEVHLPFVSVPALPMIGTIGVAPPLPGPHPMRPPSQWGGNLDIRHATAGSSITLPVGVEGALLSVGDAHAAMGAGEVCGTGVETAARVILDIELVHGAAPPTPILTTTAQSQPTGPALVTTGIGPDLLAAAQAAVRHMIDEIVAHTGLSRPQAYALCSLAGHLSIAQAVNTPAYTVSFHMPHSVITSLAGTA